MSRISFYHSTFPSLSGTFSQQQIREAMAQGLDCINCSNRGPAPGAYHPEDEDLKRDTFLLTPVKFWRYLKANCRLMIRSPLRYMRTVALALRLSDDYRFQRWRNLAQLAGAPVLAEHLEKNRVVHVNVHFALGAASLAIFLSKLSGIPYSLSIHGSDVLLPRPLIRAKLERADFIVSNCRYHVLNLRKKHPCLEKSRFYIVRGGLHLHADPWLPAVPTASKLPLRIAHVSRLHPVKAQDLLLRSLAGLKQRGIPFECRIAGHGPAERELNDLARELDLTDSVHFLGPKFTREVAELYDWSQVVALSSRSEGTPMTIIEAMAKGRSVVSPRITAIPEMVEHGVTGLLFSPGRASELTGHLAQMAGDLDMVKRMGMAGRARAEKMFDLETNVKQLLSIFAREIPGLGLKESVEVCHE
jgi:colanic acid/amylovoran biosynthesis glycosyltransferase